MISLKPTDLEANDSLRPTAQVPPAHLECPRFQEKFPEKAIVWRVFFPITILFVNAF